jgi:hypothetical protein
MAKYAVAEEALQLMRGWQNNPIRICIRCIEPATNCSKAGGATSPVRQSQIAAVSNIPGCALTSAQRSEYTISLPKALAAFQ